MHPVRLKKSHLLIPWLCLGSVVFLGARHSLQDGVSPPPGDASKRLDSRTGAGQPVTDRDRAAPLDYRGLRARDIPREELRYARLLKERGDSSRNRGEKVAAEDHYRQAEEYFERAADHAYGLADGQPLASAALRDLATMLISQSDRQEEINAQFDDALSLTRRALELDTWAGSQRGQFRDYIALAQIYSKRKQDNDGRDAHDAIQAALNVSQHIQGLNADEVISPLITAAFAQVESGRGDAAGWLRSLDSIADLPELRNIPGRDSDLLGWSATLSDETALAHMFLNQFDAAIEFFGRSSTTWKQVQHLTREWYSRSVPYEFLKSQLMPIFVQVMSIERRVELSERGSALSEADIVLLKRLQGELADLDATATKENVPFSAHRFENWYLRFAGIEIRRLLSSSTPEDRTTLESWAGDQNVIEEFRFMSGYALARLAKGGIDKERAQQAVDVLPLHACGMPLYRERNDYLETHLKRHRRPRCE